MIHLKTSIQNLKALFKGNGHSLSSWEKYKQKKQQVKISFHWVTVVCQSF